MCLHMRRRLANVFTQRGQDCMLALRLQHVVFMDLDRVKTGPSSGEMWGFTASRQCLLRYSCLYGVRYPSLNHEPTISIIIIHNRLVRESYVAKVLYVVGGDHLTHQGALLCSLFETK